MSKKNRKARIASASTSTPSNSASISKDTMVSLYEQIYKEDMLHHQDDKNVESFLNNYVSLMDDYVKEQSEIWNVPFSTWEDDGFLPEPYLRVKACYVFEVLHSYFDWDSSNEASNYGQVENQALLNFVGFDNLMHCDYCFGCGDW